MKLWTKELEQKAIKFPLYSQDGKGKRAKVLVKYFNPYGTGTWIITEAEKQENGDWLLFKIRKSTCSVANSDLKEIYTYPTAPPLRTW